MSRWRTTCCAWTGGSISRNMKVWSRSTPSTTSGHYVRSFALSSKIDRERSALNWKMAC